MLYNNLQTVYHLNVIYDLQVPYMLQIRLLLFREIIYGRRGNHLALCCGQGKLENKSAG